MLSGKSFRGTIILTPPHLDWLHPNLLLAVVISPRICSNRLQSYTTYFALSIRTWWQTVVNQGGIHIDTVDVVSSINRLFDAKNDSSWNTVVQFIREEGQILQGQDVDMYLRGG